MSQKQTEPAPSGLSLAKLVLILCIIVSFGVVLGTVGYALINPSASLPSPKITTSPTLKPTSAPALNVEDDVENWNVYRGAVETNYPLNFSLRYPSNWKITNNNESDRKSLYTKDDNGDEYQFSLGWGGHGVDGSLQGQGDLAVYKSENTTYGNYKATKDFTFRKSNNKLESILIVFDGYQGAIFEMSLLDIENDRMNEQIIKQVDKILNTISFDAETQDDISDWKTYRNEEYGFEFKYPLSSNIKEDSQKNESGEFPRSLSLNISSSNFDGLILVNNPGMGFETFNTTISSEKIKIDDIEASFDITEESDAMSKETGIKLENLKRGVFIGFEKNGNNYFMLFSYKKRGADQISLIKGILSTFKFTEKTDELFSCGTSTITDIDKNIYKTVQIGSQCWMKENLKVTKNPKGEAITRYCYDDDPKICETDGGLYNWNTAMNNSTIESTQGICPSGWHIPKDSEWYILEKGLATGSCDAIRNGLGCDPAGTKLKKGGSSGFENIFAGSRNDNGTSFHGRDAFAYLWSSSESGTNALGRYLNSGFVMVYREPNNKDGSYSIRCLKDE